MSSSLNSQTTPNAIISEENGNLTIGDTLKITSASFFQVGKLLDSCFRMIKSSVIFIEFSTMDKTKIRIFKLGF